MATVRTMMGRLLVGSAVMGMPAMLVTDHAVAQGQKAPASNDPLVAKGLVKSGSTYILPAEGDILKAMGTLRTLRTKIDTETRQRQQIERQINAAKGAVANLEFEKQKLMEAVAAEKTAAGQNRIIAQVKLAESRIAEAGAYKAEQEALLRKLGEQTRAEYVAKVVEVSSLIKKTTKQYQELASDPEVTDALAKLNAPGKPKVKLGPTPELVAAEAQVKKWKVDTNAAVIPIRMSGNVPTAEVTLDGKITRTFVVDTGAGIVSLPPDLASDLGLEPNDTHPTLRLQLADGKIVEAKQMTLKSVRVGIFTVENVECAVLPKTMVAATPLLGGSFLGNFIYKLDPKAGELHLARVGNDARIKIDANDDEEAEAPRKDVTTSTKNPPAADSVPNSTPLGGNPPPTNPATPNAEPLATNDTAPKVPDSTRDVTPETPKTPAADTPASGDTKKVIEYLEREYKLKLASPDWRQRALAVISLARLPQPEVTEKLLGLVDSDKDNVVRLIAWQAVLSRASSLATPEYQRWMNSTYALAEKGAFKGTLRLPLLDVLSTSPMNARSRRIFENIFNQTNAWEPADIPVLRALGQCLGKWKNSGLAEALINVMGDQNHAYRAEFVLQRAGFNVPTARDRLDPSVFDPSAPQRSHVSSEQLWLMAQKDYAASLGKVRSEWSSHRIPADAYKSLKAFYVPAPVSVGELDATPDLWKADLELGKTNLKQFEVAFVVDATGSMGDVLAWMSRDVLKMMAALGTVAPEPRVGITFFRDQGDEFVTRHLPLTHRGEDLVAAMKGVGAAGGGDLEGEAMLEGLKDAVLQNKWHARQDGGKAIVIVTDGNPHARDMNEAIALAKKARSDGFRIYAVKATTEYGGRDLSRTDQIARAAGGEVVDVTFARLGQVRFLGPDQKEISLQTIPRPEAQVVVAGAPADDLPGEKILAMIISDAINPQYRDRLQPLVRTLLASCEQPSPVEKRMPFPANTPPLGRADRANVQGK